MNRKIRNSLFKIHTWMGLHLSLFFVFMFLTGTLLVAGFELESVGRPNIWTMMAKEDRTASFGMIYEGVKETHPQSRPFVIVKRSTPWFVDQTFGDTGWGEAVTFWTDPVTGGIVEETRNLGFRNILRDLHDTLLTEKRVVFILVSATSVFLLGQIISGFVTYRRFWKGFFRWPNRSNGLRSWAGGVHRLTALWSAPVMILIALTSLYFMLGGLGMNGTTPELPSSSPRDSALPSGFGPEMIDTAEARAHAALPGFDPVVMLIPGSKADSLVFIGHVEGVAEFRGMSSVALDPATLEVLGVMTPDGLGGLAKWKDLMNMLHFGTWAGAFSMALWIVFGLIATGVAVTGAMIFSARLRPDAARHGPFRRIWRGMGWTRWIYLLLLAGMLFTAYHRFNPGAYDATRAYPVNADGSVARLILRAPLRHETPLDVEMRIGAPDVVAVSIEIDSGPARSVELTRHDAKATAYFQLTPAETQNEITANLKKSDGKEEAVIFRLGHPIW
ncbi:PepSY domain-containing protein [Ruegeria sp. 6PALISEP08]|uniref:PepSY-associated TM helix domain-containing protein n=1 Tax=Ruegeria sp. 6PALISEP08 TaxID=1225660 RepID=UPI000A962B02|nr:PepSY-associated TM helix domain-containing protein [Ruegeria sp. 6PALISEP08]